MTAHSDWWKRVPKCLTEPLPFWHDPPPTGTSDPRWQEYQRQRIANQARVIAEVVKQLDVKGSPRRLAYWRDLALGLLELTPAMEVLRESRGRKQNPDADPESIARRKRRALQRADKYWRNPCP
jgi:hypothetical protein